jgi:hypothetical protein
VLKRSEEVPEIGVQHPVHPPPAKRLVQSGQRLMGAASGSRPVREAGELGLVHGIEDRDRRTLDDLVLEGRHADRPLLRLRIPALGDVDPPDRLRAVGTATHPIRQLGQVRLQILAIVLPRLAVHAWCRITFQLVERRPERVDGVDVVQQRGESHSLLLFSCLPYPPQRRVHARPALSPERGGLWRVPLGQPPFLQPLRRPPPGLVRSLPRYCAAV